MDRTIPARGKGNDAAVTVIDQCASLVHEGEAAFVACIMVKDTSELVTIHGGKPGLEFTAMGGAEMLKDILKDELKKRSRPPEVQEPLGNCYYWNCTLMPLAFDFLPALLQAEMRRRRKKAPSPLRIGFFWGANPNSTLRTPWQKQCYEGLLLQMPQLIGGIVDPLAVSGGQNMGETASTTSFFPIVEAYNNGEDIPKIVATEAAVKDVRKIIKQQFGGQAPVTITLRETDHHPWRNSVIPEWILFAEWLKERGEKVIFLRDTKYADEELRGQITCPPASKNLHFRVALYQEAKCNLFVSNGPAMLPVFMDCPWLFFNAMADERKDFYVGTTDGWERSTGIPVNGQWPWAKPMQRIVWHEDKFEHMTAAWLEHIAPRAALLEHIDNGQQRLAG
jgi:hypothetical protein